MARMNYGLFITITITGFFAICKGAGQNEEDLQENLLHSSMPPNSKFLNPHLDDDANLQLAIAAFADAYDSPGTGDILSKPGDVKFQIEPKDLRRGKYLNHWNAISLLNNLFAKRSKKY